jgi:hypothetical protein
MKYDTDRKNRQVVPEIPYPRCFLAGCTQGVRSAGWRSVRGVGGRNPYRIIFDLNEYD